MQPTPTAVARAPASATLALPTRSASVPASGEVKRERSVTNEYSRPRSEALAPHAAVACSGTIVRMRDSPQKKDVLRRRRATCRRSFSKAPYDLKASRLISSGERGGCLRDCFGRVSGKSSFNGVSTSRRAPTRRKGIDGSKRCSTRPPTSGPSAKARKPTALSTPSSSPLCRGNLPTTSSVYACVAQRVVDEPAPTHSRAGVSWPSVRAPAVPNWPIASMMPPTTRAGLRPRTSVR
mmetsp:Transcript_18402/g.47139  ORF Transcript_18402/g.47139 Transcript_18402/m.47139 type:complete len:237 (+) Transcript_18402:573-1283(+)